MPSSFRMLFSHINAMARQLLNRKPSNPKRNTIRLGESGRTLVREDLAGLRRSTVRERELEVLGKELLDVRTADALVVLDLNNAENLENCQ